MKQMNGWDWRHRTHVNGLKNSECSIIIGECWWRKEELEINKMFHTEKSNKKQSWESTPKKIIITQLFSYNIIQQFFFVRVELVGWVGGQCRLIQICSDFSRLFYPFQKRETFSLINCFCWSTRLWSNYDVIMNKKDVGAGAGWRNNDHDFQKSSERKNKQDKHWMSAMESQGSGSCIHNHRDIHTHTHTYT